MSLKSLTEMVTKQDWYINFLEEKLGGTFRLTPEDVEVLMAKQSSHPSPSIPMGGLISNPHAIAMYCTAEEED